MQRDGFPFARGIPFPSDMRTFLSHLHVVTSLHKELTLRGKRGAVQNFCVLRVRTLDAWLTEPHVGVAARDGKGIITVLLGMHGIVTVLEIVRGLRQAKIIDQIRLGGLKRLGIGRGHGQIVKLQFVARGCGGICTGEIGQRGDHALIARTSTTHGCCAHNGYDAKRECHNQ